MDRLRRTKPETLRWLGRALCAVAVVSTVGTAWPASFGGHIKVQQQYLDSAADSLSTALGYADAGATSLDLRLIAKASRGRFGFEADYLLTAVTGRAVELENRLEALDPERFVDREAVQWLDLTHTLKDSGNTYASQSLDRFSLSYTSERWVLDLGRQAHSWANGLVFRPLDLFDPFAPDALDPSYKPGIDAVYVQRLLADGSDVAALIVPRRDPATGRLSRDQSSAAVKWHAFGSALQTDLLVARDYRDTVVGLGLSGSLGQAVWRMSLVPVWLDAGGTRTSLVANLEHAWQWQGRNISGYVEYFHNGFGQAGRRYTLDDLDRDLVVRLARGQVFNTGRDYIAGGLRMQLTPLLGIDPVLLLNARDRSALLIVEGAYSLAENLSLDFGARAGIGSAGTEFGGLRTATGSTVFDAAPTRIYARLAYYF
jgi:hypothetical protein